MVIAAAGLVLARTVKQPPVLGYLVAGMVIGPFTLPTPLISNLDTIGVLAELGLILLLFGIGSSWAGVAFATSDSPCW